jgi:hypothetical protein
MPWQLRPCVHTQQEPPRLTRQHMEHERFPTTITIAVPPIALIYNSTTMNSQPSAKIQLLASEINTGKDWNIPGEVRSSLPRREEIRGGGRAGGRTDRSRRRANRVEPAGESGRIRRGAVWAVVAQAVAEGGAWFGEFDGADNREAVYGR